MPPSLPESTVGSLDVRATNFLHHSTISRDQTQARKAQEELQSFQILFEKTVEFSPETPQEANEQGEPNSPGSGTDTNFHDFTEDQVYYRHASLALASLKAKPVSASRSLGQALGSLPKILDFESYGIRPSAKFYSLWPVDNNFDYSHNLNRPSDGVAPSWPISGFPADSSATNRAELSDREEVDGSSDNSSDNESDNETWSRGSVQQTGIRPSESPFGVGHWQSNSRSPSRTALTASASMSERPYTYGQPPPQVRYRRAGAVNSDAPPAGRVPVEQGPPPTPRTHLFGPNRNVTRGLGDETQSPERRLQASAQEGPTLPRSSPKPPGRVPPRRQVPAHNPFGYPAVPGDNSRNDAKGPGWYESHGDRDDVRRRIQELTAELEALKAHTGEDERLETASPLSAAWKIVYRIADKPYLNKPEWVHGNMGLIKLSSSVPLTNLEELVDRNPDILFLVFKDFWSDKYPWPLEKKGELADVNTLRTPKPSSEAIQLTPRAISAMVAFSETYLDFETVFPGFDFSAEIQAPYPLFFYMFPEWEEHILQIDERHQDCIGSIFEYLHEIIIPEYRDVLHHFDTGKARGSHLPYLFKPGDIVVRPWPSPTAFMISSWAQSLGTYPATGKGDSVHSKDKRGDPVMHVKTNHNSTWGLDNESEKLDGYEMWTVEAWNWSLEDVRLYRHWETLEIQVQRADTNTFDINTLKWFPLKYAADETKQLLLTRGNNFWRCRDRQFVEYAYSDGNSELENVNERFMIDFSMYRKLHPEFQETSSHRHTREREQKPDTELMNMAELPKDGSINLFPKTIIGYNLRMKKWVDIAVDGIQDVTWNKKAFENLVVDNDTKHLVEALISKQLKAERSTDLISGKGNGLIMLLHGGPGTGKTFTAESVAELAEKPLYRVTCGDLGTKAEKVEKYLESVLLLGKTWGCVVLLDEADVFLEERSLKDIKRNALVSVFLRVLEYYDGILILTSNRVGTFDQAFKSRIQLALHYGNLSKSQRYKIWQNFFSRLQDLGEKDMNIADLYAHVGELAEHEMNGRQIRNAITTARQLAQFDGKDLTHELLLHVIKVASKFESYLKSVNQELSEDQLARDCGYR